MYWYTRYGSGAESENSESEDYKDVKESITSGHNSNESCKCDGSLPDAKRPKV